jgi:hypothetical protein
MEAWQIYMCWALLSVMILAPILIHLVLKSDK